MNTMAEMLVGVISFALLRFLAWSAINLGSWQR
jgi:hypothetical protein